MNYVRTTGALLALWIFGSALWAEESPSDYPDIRSVAPDLIVPRMEATDPAPGRRVKQTLPAWAGRNIYHSLYLPKEWTVSDDRRWPVVIEFPGNGGYHNRYGDRCTGKPEDCRFGYGLTGGKHAIWVCAPFLNASGKAITVSWWGDGPNYDPEPTVAYLEALTTHLCVRFHGDPDRLLLTGFSRGALACHVIGLHHDTIAKRWCGMIPYSHYDGVRSWPYQTPGSELPQRRLRRLRCPQAICHEGAGLKATERYLQEAGVSGSFTFIPTGFRNHSDAWILRPSPARDQLRHWLDHLWARSD